MRLPMITNVFLLAATAAMAEGDTDCAALGLTNDYLTTHFCTQLQELGQAGTTGTTRSIVQEGDPDAGDSPVAEWESIGLIQDAYRADPRKTLELIERIKGAGGLASETSQ